MTCPGTSHPDCPWHSMPPGYVCRRCGEGRAGPVDRLWPPDGEDRRTPEARALDAEERAARAEAYAQELEAKLRETEADMHVRIRMEYDRTIADSWRAKVAEVERERDEARAVARDCLDAINADCWPVLWERIVALGSLGSGRR